jgi:hypothetical protein
MSVPGNVPSKVVPAICVLAPSLRMPTPGSVWEYAAPANKPRNTKQRKTRYNRIRNPRAETISGGTVFQRNLKVKRYYRLHRKNF